MAPRLHPLAPCRSGSGLLVVVMAAAPLLGCPQGSDPRPIGRVSIRTTPTKTPRGEATAVTPIRGGGRRRALAGVPTPGLGGGGMAGGTSATVLRLPFALRVTSNVPRPPPPLRWHSDNLPGRQRAPPDQEVTEVGCATPMDGGLPMETGAGAGDAHKSGRGDGGATSKFPSTPSAALSAAGGGNGGRHSTGRLPPPPATGLGIGPSTWQEGVHTSKVHQGAPWLDDGF